MASTRENAWVQAPTLRRRTIESRQIQLQRLWGKREQLRFLNWLAFTPALTQTEREQYRRPSQAVVGRALVPAEAFNAGKSARPKNSLKALWDKRGQLLFLSWAALTPTLSQRERERERERKREQKPSREAAALIKPGPSAARARVRNSKPLLVVPRSAGRGAGAQRSMRASCSDSLPLFERRERSEQSEFGSAAPRPSIAGCPKGHGQWGRLSLPTFFGGAKKVGRPPGRTPGRQRIQVTINSIADCAFPTSASARFH